MSSSTDQFWENPEDWSRRKHIVLGYYLTPAAPKLRTQSSDGKVYVLDGFAGRGQYSDGSPGSPVLMGQLAATCRGWKSPVALTIYNDEPDADSFGDLSACTKEGFDAGYIMNYRATFQESLPGILKSVGPAPLFAFLDPFRPSHLSFADMLPLLERTDTTEVCIVFHTPGVMRVLDALRPAARTPERSKSGMAAHLEQVLGGRRWERLLSAPNTTPEDVISCLDEEIRSRVKRGRLYICSHGIQARYNVGLKYHIVFVTRHPDGVQLMNDAFCKEAGTLYEKVAVTRTQTLDLGLDESPVPSVERTPANRIAELTIALIEIGRKQPERLWRRDDLRFASMERRFGEFTWAEHRQAIDNLLHRTTPPTLVAPTIQPKKTGQIVTNEDTPIRFRW